MYRYLSTSREAGNHALNFGIIPNPRIATYLPRKGPETNKLKYYSDIFQCIDTYLPREGRKPAVKCYRTVDILTFRHLSTSRGAGNRVLRVKVGLTGFCISPYLPREGTDTVQRCPFQPFQCRYSYLSTSGGVGNASNPLIVTSWPSCIATYLPREGPETLVPSQLLYRGLRV